MFIDNKYTKWYYNIIEKAKNQILTNEGELHHILPKCICPEYSNLKKYPENGVYLTYREHFLAHWLLTKMTSNKHYMIKLKHALGNFVQCSPNNERIITGRRYNKARLSISEARLGVRHSNEAREKNE